MKIVIDIPEGMLDELHTCKFPIQEAYRLCEVIENGTPLPKGHGALKDVSRMVFDKYLAIDVRAIHSGEWDVFKVGYNAGIDDAKNVLSEAPTIIEADKEGAEE